MNTVFSALAAAASGALGAMGMGGGGILMIYLTLAAGIPHATAQGINLLFFIPTAIVAVIIYSRKKLIDYKIALIYGLAGTLGACGGCYVSGMLDNNILSKIFAVFIIFIGVKELFSKAK
ncbi:MAG: sulfite exporter TauE/SafE family protein [Clostridiales bacterium]|nr:sulfite exporter TauE/SafE family protein [Clostridiales bacterium]